MDILQWVSRFLRLNLVGIALIASPYSYLKVVIFVAGWFAYNDSLEGRGIFMDAERNQWFRTYWLSLHVTVPAALVLHYSQIWVTLTCPVGLIWVPITALLTMCLRSLILWMTPTHHSP